MLCGFFLVLPKFGAMARRGRGSRSGDREQKFRGAENEAGLKSALLGSCLIDYAGLGPFVGRACVRVAWFAQVVFLVGFLIVSGVGSSGAWESLPGSYSAPTSGRKKRGPYVGPAAAAVWGVGCCCGGVHVLPVPVLPVPAPKIAKKSGRSFGKGTPTPSKKSRFPGGLVCAKPL